jgi:hypothetical protein
MSVSGPAKFLKVSIKGSFPLKRFKMGRRNFSSGC